MGEESRIKAKDLSVFWVIVSGGLAAVGILLIGIGVIYRPFPEHLNYILIYGGSAIAIIGASALGVCAVAGQDLDY